MDMGANVAPEAALPTPTLGTRAIMLGGGLLGALALMAITSVLPRIEAELGQRPSDSLLVKQLVGVVSLTMVIGAPLAGFLVDRVGLRVVLVLSALVYAVAGTAGLYLDGLPLLVVSRAFVGIAAAAIQITSITLINTRLPVEQRARWMGAHIAVAMIGTIIVHPLAGFLGEIGWRWPFALYAVGLLMVPVALFDRSPSEAGQTLATPAKDRPDAETRRKARLLSWFPLRYAVLALFIGGISYVPMVYIPFLLRAHGMESPSLISLVLTADSIAGAIMAMLYGRARRRLSSNGAFAFSFAMTAAGTFVAAISPTIVGVVTGLLIFGFGVGWFIANLMTALGVAVSRAQQGRAVGLVKASHFLSAPLCIMVMEPFARAHGPASAMLVVSATALILLVITGARMMQTRRGGSGRPHATRPRIRPVNG
jgi:MFS family permease